MNLSNAEQNILTKKLTSFFINDVLNGVTVDDVLRTENGKMFWMNKELTASQVKVLQTEAQQFLNSQLWKVLKAELIWQAQSKTLSKAETEMDLMFGKVMKLWIETIEERLNKLGAKKV